MRRNLTRIIAAAGALVLLLALSACNRGEDAGRSMTLAVSTLSNPFFIELRNAAQAAAKREGVELEIVDAQDDAAAQANQLANAATQDFDAVLVNPVDEEAAKQAVEPLVEDDIPVIAVDREVRGVDVTTMVASNNVDGGRQAGEAVVDAIGGQGQVIHLQGIPGTSASRDRGAGFTQALSDASGVEVVAKQTANFDRAEALDVTTNLLQANPGVSAIFAENDEMALGAIEALGPRAGRDVQVFGYDATPDGLEAVRNGSMHATVAQEPATLGRRAVELAVASLEDKEVPPTETIPVSLVTQQNVEEYVQ